LIGGNSADNLIGGAGTNQISFSTGGNTSSGNTGGTTSSSGGTLSNSGGLSTSSSPSSSQTSNVWLSNGVLYLTGTTSQENSLTVDVGANGTIWGNANGHTLNPSASSVKSINISGGNGVDWVYINSNISIPAVINTYGGNDNIQGGSGYDTINTGDGNDYVKASGNITLGNGNNTVWVGSQGSTVTSGNGSSMLVGGPGNDTITAGSGYNTIIGGAGADVLTGGNNSTFSDAGSQDKVTKGGTTTNPTTPPVSSSPTPPAQQTPPPITPGQTVSGPEDATVYGSNHGDSLAPTPVILLTGTSGQTEHSVFVNALNSTLASGTPLTATYQWNFGDPGSRFNTLPGWNAGHIYNNPGTYTITLTITNEAGHTSSVSTQIAISGSQRRTLYVDAWHGSDSNSGTSSSSPLKTWQRADQLLTNNTTVLFARGEEFDFGDTFQINNSNVTIGAYGSGAAPVMMKVPGGGHGVFYAGGSSDQVVIENLTFDSVYKPSGNYAPDIDATGLYAGGRNITFRNNTILNMEDAVDSYQSPTGLLIQDNSSPNKTGLRGYLDWMSGTDQVIIGNYVVNSSRQHVVRSSSTNSARVLIAGNNFANPSDPANGDTPKTTINIRAGSYVDIESNTLADGTMAIGPDSSLPESTAVEWIKINGNTTSDMQTQIHWSVHHAMFSNNVMQQETYPMLEIDPKDPTYSSRYLADITVAHNTGILQGTIGTMLQIDNEPQWQAIKVIDNLMSAPNMQPGNDFSSAVIIKAWDLNGEIFSHNVWAAPWAGWTGYAGGVNLVDPYWDVKGYKTAQQWNAYSNVSDDQFRQVWVNSSNYTTSIDGQTAGAAVPVKLG
ncbi:MAG TPA: PKD domain-containing protein, partial [Tepidisphaeraceae bacterium]|nr:PKD domain-containing protein [Tepidisphaeraceae bacterium]